MLFLFNTEGGSLERFQGNAKAKIDLLAVLRIDTGREAGIVKLSSDTKQGRGYLS